jgi:hypothetical protein
MEVEAHSRYDALILIVHPKYKVREGSTAAPLAHVGHRR